MDDKFVSSMKGILDIYEMLYDDSAAPVICIDEKLYQLLGEAREPLPRYLGDAQKIGSEYVHNGICSIFAFVEPLGGVRYVSVQRHCTTVDRAEEIKYLVDVGYSDCDRIILVMDNLNTHDLSYLYKAFSALEACKIAKKLEIRYKVVQRFKKVLTLHKCYDIIIKSRAKAIW